MPRALVFLWDEDESNSIAIPEEPDMASILIGRERSSCDVPVPAGVAERKTISRSHARIYRRGEEYWIEDLQSRNFTLVADQIVLAPRKIDLPVNLRLGQTSLRVEVRNLPVEELERRRPHAALDPEETGGPTQGRAGAPGGRRQTRPEIEDQLRWAAAMQATIEILNRAPRLREAETQLRDTLKFHMEAEHVELALGLQRNRFTRLLAQRGVQPAQIERLLVALDADHLRSEVQHTAFDGGRIHVWVARTFGARSHGSSVLIARFAEPLTGEDELRRTADLVSISLRMIDPYMGALRELEHFHSTRLDAVMQEPGPRVLEACKEAGFIGSSSAIRRCLYKSEIAGARYLHESPLRGGLRKLPAAFLLGESGSGKTEIARLIHRLSDHAKGPYVEINCAALTDSLMTSELFGYAQGSHSAAVSRKEGLFKAADGGIIFLDEIGHASRELQADILKVLDTGMFYRVGGTEQVHTNCYVILASIEHPLELVREGKFLEELWYRVGGFNITVPPLRDRLEDVEALVHARLTGLKEEYAKHSPSNVSRVSNSVMALFKGYPWRGNVRQLMQCLEAAYALTPPTAEEIDVFHLPDNLVRDLGIGGHAEEPMIAGVVNGKTLKDYEEALKREYYVKTLAAHRGEKKAAALHAGVCHRTLYGFLKELREWYAEKATPPERTRIRDWAGPYFRSIVGKVEEPPGDPPINAAATATVPSLGETQPYLLNE